MFLMRFDHLVAHSPDFIEGQGGRRVRIHHDCLVNVLPFFGQRGFDGKVLHVDIGAADGGQLWGQVSNMSGLQSIAIDQDGNFHATTIGQVGNQIAVWNIPVEDDGVIRLSSVNNVRPILVRLWKNLKCLSIAFA